MKVMSFCVAILAALAWSNIFTLSGSLSFEKGYLNIDTTKTCNVDTTYINCSLENGLAYYSTLDTAIAVFFQPRYSIGAVVVPSPITTGVVNYSHTFTQVMRYEFMNWVDWGIIVMDRDSAQRLLDRILPDSISIESRVINHKKVCDVDPSQCVGWGAYGGGAEGVISDEQAARLPTKKFQIDEASVPSETPKSEQPGGTLKLGAGTIHVGNISLESGSKVEFLNPGRETVIIADGSLNWSAQIVNSDLQTVAKGFKLIEYAPGYIHIEGDWAGTIHARWCELTLGQVKKTAYGSFVAKKVYLGNGLTIYRIHFCPIPLTDMV
ncbi:hypothetical protein [Fibrobacter sp.]|uniref:hypothetical protein n=1 Tax=Fibrobacter sp. TaxID=35828 RepID=UPI00388F6B06